MLGHAAPFFAGLVLHRFVTLLLYSFLIDEKGGVRGVEQCALRSLGAVGALNPDAAM